MKKLLIFSLSLLALVFTGCSSDTDELGGTRSMNEYTPDQIQQIQNLQEEYGVTFDFPTKSEKELPSVNEIEDVCKIAASLQACTKSLKVVGNTATNKPTGRVKRTRGFGQGMEYSGQNVCHSDIGCYGIVYYSFKWDNVYNNDVRGFSYTIDDIYSFGKKITFDKFEYTYSGLRHIDYTMYFSIYLSSGKIPYELRGSVSL